MYVPTFFTNMCLVQIFIQIGTDTLFFLFVFYICDHDCVLMTKLFFFKSQHCYTLYQFVNFASYASCCPGQFFES